MSETRKSIAEEFTGKIIENLKAGTAPWQKPWAAGEQFRPFNPVTGTVYRGINSIMLSAHDYADPRWMTFKQVGEKEWQVKKGSKSQHVVFWQWTESRTVKDASGKPILDAEEREQKETVALERPRFRIYSVFHASQLQTRDGQEIPPYEPRELTWDPNEAGEKILQNSGVSISHDQRDRAFYQPSADEIHLPPRENFPDAGNYYSTALHELGHWTGHPSRQNREFGPFGSVTYAKEELRAEIASWMLSQELGLPHDPSRSLAYVENWIQVLESDPYEIMRASRDAEKIMEHVRAMEKSQIREEQPEVEMVGVNPNPDYFLKPAQDQESPIAPHLLTRDEFSEIARAVPLGNHGRRWEVFVGDTSMGFSDADTDIGAIHDAHHTQVNNALYSRTAENHVLPVQSMPSEKVLADYPDLKTRFTDVMETENQIPVLYVIADDSFTFINSDDFGDLEKAIRFENPASALKEALDMQAFHEKRLEGSELSIYQIDADGTFRNPDGTPGNKAILTTGTRREMAAQWQQNIKTVLPEFLADLAHELPAKTTEITWLAVPYKEKDKAKAAGAKWDSTKKSWYAPAGMEVVKIAAWLPQQQKTLAAPTLAPADEFAQALKKAGLVLDGSPIMDGRIHRVPVVSGKAGAKDGAYCAYQDGRPNGWLQNHKTGVQEKWVATGHILTETERAELRASSGERLAAREKEKQAREAKAQKRAYAKWMTAKEIASHPYLETKEVENFGLKQDKYGNLLVPGFDLKTGRLQTLQRIDAEGTKNLEKDCPKIGAAFLIPPNDISSDLGNEILLAEGYATGACLHMTTGKPVAVVFSADNLLPVAESIREKFPLAKITICADDDQKLTKLVPPLPNVGVKKAQEAAMAVGGYVVVPRLSKSEIESGMTDFNDLYRSRGRKAVASNLRQKESARSGGAER